MVNNRIACGPVSLNDRSLAPDLARGFMLLLIVLAHAPIFLFGTEHLVMNRPVGVSVLDRMIDFMGYLLIDNRARCMFAALFGYGLAMVIDNQLTKGTSKQDARRLLRRRAFLLMLFGFVLSVFIGGQDILSTYGIYVLLVGWLLFRPERVLVRTLIFVGMLFLILMPFLWIGLANGLGHLGFPGMSATDTYASIMLNRLTSYPFFPISHITTPTLLPILVGMWAAHKRLLIEPYRHRQQLFRISIIGVSISVLGALPLALIGVQLWNPAPTAAGLIFALHLMTGVAGGLGYAAIFGLIGSVKNVEGRVIRSLAALGKRSLTFFVFNEAMLVLILSPAAFGLGGSLNSTGAAIVAVLIWLTSLGLATILENLNKRGPLDALFRQLVYKQNRRVITEPLNLTLDERKDS
ncbi:DUF418 domain-containing protein [Paenibacillus thiaminolyticus]|uniref:DUF418 domain-containing protein n=1 Tax=Paenibacillus thiaminolyticus TaxID=49283 RepID=UPI003D265DC7